MKAACLTLFALALVGGCLGLYFGLFVAHALGRVAIP